MSTISRKKIKVKTNRIINVKNKKNVKTHSINFKKWQKGKREASSELKYQKGSDIIPTFISQKYQKYNWRKLSKA